MNRERASAQALEAVSGPSTVLTGDLRNVDLSGHSLAQAMIENADLRGADLSGCSLSGCHIMNSDLSGANLEGSNFSGSHLMTVNLSAANLTGSNFYGAHLDSVDLRNADLGYAVCGGGHFVHVDMHDAKMCCGIFDAHFEDCHFEGADLTSSIFRGAENSTYDSSTKFPVGFSAIEYNNGYADDPEWVGLVPK